MLSWPREVNGIKATTCIVPILNTVKYMYFVQPLRADFKLQDNDLLTGEVLTMTPGCTQGTSYKKKKKNKTYLKLVKGGSPRFLPMPCSKCLPDSLY